VGAHNPRVSFGAVLRVSEFRALWLAQAQSLIGDQLARVALAVLVFDRTGSASLTAAVYALTFAPAVLGGIVLAGLADRLPRRTLMISCDVVRAVLLVMMAMRGVSLWALCVLLVVAVLVGQPFNAAEAALIPDLLAGDAYVVGSSLRMITSQLAQLIGFAVGGVVIAAIGARAGLIVDAVSFAVSALIVAVWVRHRPAPLPPPGGPGSASRSWGGQIADGARLVFGDPRLRALVGLGWLAAFHIVPEGLAPPYAASLGGGPVAVGMLMAAPPTGCALGALVLVRFAPATRRRMIGALAVATALPMIACLEHPGLLASIALWGLAGVFSAYQVPAAAAFIGALPAAGRGQAIGLVSSGLIAIQGLGVLTFGGVATAINPAAAIAVAGLAAGVVAVPLAVVWSRSGRRPRPVPVVGAVR
jgi:hypothetical protein